MTRDELTALRDVLDLILRLPDDLRAQVAAWLSPAAPKPGNGLDPHPPPTVTPGKASGARTDLQPAAIVAGGSTKPTPYAGKARRGKSPTSAAFAEQQLLTAMQEHSGASVDALAKAAGANRSSTGERLRQLARRGVVTKDAGGHWRLTADLAGEAAGPMSAPPSI